LKVKLEVADSTMISDMEKIIKKSFPVIEKSGGKVKAIITEATKEAYNRIKDTLEREIRQVPTRIFQ
jgi:Fe-S cluster biogenesis protein NfuA